MYFLFNTCFPSRSLPPQAPAQQMQDLSDETAPSEATLEAYVKNGNIEKLLAILSNPNVEPEPIWRFALTYPNSPALYLCVIQGLKIEDACKKEVIAVLKLKQKDLVTELPDLMVECYGILAQRSYNDVEAYNAKMLETLIQPQSLFRLAMMNESKKLTYTWAEFCAAVSLKRVNLMIIHKPKPTPPEKQSCFPKGWCK